MAEQMQKCDNCLRDFPQSKIATHFGYCRRNIKKCNECGEMYDINSQEEHEEQFHKKAKCQYCKTQFKVQDLESHRSSCTKKTKFCEYCELNVPINEYNGHLRGCQARTKPCDKCNKPIMNKDYLIHLVSCTGPQEEISKPASNYENYLKKQRERQKQIKGTKQRELKGYEQFIKNERVQPNAYRYVEQRKNQDFYQKQIKPKVQYSHQTKNQSNQVPTRASSNSRGGIGLTNQVKKQVKQNFGNPSSKQIPSKNINYLNNKAEPISYKVEKKIETKKLVPTSGLDKRQIPNFERRDVQNFQKKESQAYKPSSYSNNLKPNHKPQISKQSSNKYAIKNEVPKREPKSFDPQQYGGYDAQIPHEALQYQHPSNFNGHNMIDEDEQFQKAIMQSLEGEKKKLTNMKNLPKELQGQDLMGKSFYQDMDERKQLELYEQIQRNARKNKR